jgi:methylmalonyl-CoA mutase cobalamin-binding subunit
VIGGIVPDADLSELEAAGVAAVLGPGASVEEVVSTVRSAAGQKLESPEPGAGSSAVTELADASRSGDRRATARLLSLVERGGDPADEVASAAHAHVGGAHVVGITGAPGSGKSTITNSLTTLLAEAGRRPAVLAVDPSSP